ncbi:undecaprenyl-diphosphate phosphatase [Wenzhouxiangella sp. XN79A]|uniref:undecaprenyl-diphosphate phosphatase n=1 Tax=Wenzhouxiangella sp. XN79A TaxID=2724193 RepID=UPI00144AE1C1|nr:undecaprenyl-diphosphate phosphatase [Wenzhouxiangella sp. XN79A]
MTFFQLIVLALIQGVSEFLPVSSSAHLALVAPLTGWADQGLAFDAAVHAGTLVAVMLHLRPELTGLLRDGLPGRDPVQRVLLIGLVIATLPALLVGAFAADWIEAWLRSPLLIAVTTIVFGLLLGAADRWGRGARPVESVGWRSALLIGLAQTLALIPGTSRSGVTITAGLALGLAREAAARYSFLLSIPIIAAAGSWGFVRGLRDGGSFELAQFALAAAVSGLFAWLTIAAFLAWLRRAGMLPFVVYRLILGIALLVLFWPQPG